jgi:hypothetical protein
MTDILQQYRAHLRIPQTGGLTLPDASDPDVYAVTREGAAAPTYSSSARPVGTVIEPESTALPRDQLEGLLRVRDDSRGVLCATEWVQSSDPNSKYFMTGEVGVRMSAFQPYGSRAWPSAAVRDQTLNGLARALADLHARGWVYRALSPADIVLNLETGAVKLMPSAVAARVGSLMPRWVGHTKFSDPLGLLAAAWSFRRYSETDAKSLDIEPLYRYGLLAHDGQFVASVLQDCGAFYVISADLMNNQKRIGLDGPLSYGGSSGDVVTSESITAANAFLDAAKMSGKLEHVRRMYSSTIWGTRAGTGAGSGSGSGFGSGAGRGEWMGSASSPALAPVVAKSLDGQLVPPGDPLLSFVRKWLSFVMDGSADTSALTGSSRALRDLLHHPPGPGTAPVGATQSVSDAGARNNWLHRQALVRIHTTRAWMNPAVPVDMAAGSLGPLQRIVPLPLRAATAGLQDQLSVAWAPPPLGAMALCDQVAARHEEWKSKSASRLGSATRVMPPSLHTQDPHDLTIKLIHKTQAPALARWLSSDIAMDPCRFGQIDNFRTVHDQADAWRALHWMYRVQRDGQSLLTHYAHLAFAVVRSEFKWARSSAWVKDVLVLQTFPQSNRAADAACAVMFPMHAFEFCGGALRPTGVEIGPRFSDRPGSLMEAEEVAAASSDNKFEGLRLCFLELLVSQWDVTRDHVVQRVSSGRDRTRDRDRDMDSSSSSSDSSASDSGEESGAESKTSPKSKSKFNPKSKSNPKGGAGAGSGAGDVSADEDEEETFRDKHPLVACEALLRRWRAISAVAVLSGLGITHKTQSLLFEAMLAELDLTRADVARYIRSGHRRHRRRPDRGPRAR